MAGLWHMLMAAAAMLLPCALSAQTRCPFPSPSRSTLAWKLGDAPGQVTGWILDAWTERPPAEAAVWLRPISDSATATATELHDARGVQRFLAWMDTPPLFTLVDSTGRFVIPGVPAGQYYINVSAHGIGALVQDTVSVGGSGLRIVAVLTSLRQPHSCLGPAVPPPHNDAWY